MALLRQKFGYTFGYTLVTQCEKCVTFFFWDIKSPSSPCFNLRRNFLRSLPKKISQQQVKASVGHYARSVA